VGNQILYHTEHQEPLISFLKVMYSSINNIT
jgi:hypothetical protein